jgi:AcrR family transcriptional regulator
VDVNGVNIAWYSLGMGRTTYHHGNLREALVDAAVGLVRSRGPEAVSLRELARELEVSPAAIYRHFPDRDAVLAEVGRLARGQLAARMLAAVEQVRRRDAKARSIDRFLAVGRAYIAFAGDEPHLLTAAFLPIQMRQDEPEEPNPWSVLAGSLDDLVSVGALSPTSRVGAEVIAWSAVHGFSTLRQTGAFGTSGEPDPNPEELLLGIARALGLESGGSKTPALPRRT